LPAAEQILGAPLDPLAPAFLDRVRARTRAHGSVVPDSN
jgi:hypothetical protein